MITKILLAGSGGQGVLTVGNILGNAAMLENNYSTYLPAYGAAMRGGTANCTVCISDSEIASPVASSPDILVAFNQPSVLKFINRLEPGDQMIYNSSIIDTVPIRGDLEIFPVPGNEVAIELGNERSANMVIFGAFIKLTNTVKLETVFESIDILMGAKKKKLATESKKILQEGYDRFPFEIKE
ncbi:MAG: 2-oxoacid:acceptor oxidoreductase family protein [Spirochaetes bacterium]|nr:2-oxoacid:acceptor oxidoreductase family protein [Spirochaetota bacterium]